MKAFSPITLVAQAPNVLVMNAISAQQLGLRSLRDLVGFAKKNPGQGPRWIDARHLRRRLPNTHSGPLQAL